MEKQSLDDNTPEDSAHASVERSERWARKAEFMFACIGFVIGYGNIWRFPYMCFKNGGGNDTLLSVTVKVVSYATCLCHYLNLYGSCKL